jgi:hypothetical protein
MAMQSDVSASKPLTSSGQMVTQSGGNIPRCRVKALSIIPTASAGSVALSDGGSSGPIRITINTVASATQPMYILLPGEGILFNSDVYATITNVGSVVAIYG